MKSFALKFVFTPFFLLDIVDLENLEVRSVTKKNLF